MATRSRIGIYENGRVRSVYCHWDGYPEYVGLQLVCYYDEQSRAEELVSLGDISALRRTIGEQHPFGWNEAGMSYVDYDKQYGEMTVFYGRDRGETGVEARVSDTFEEFLDLVAGSGGEYYYVFRDGKWYGGSMHERDTEHYRRLESVSQMLRVREENLEPDV